MHGSESWKRWLNTVKFLLDNGLNPNIADALSLVEYDITSVREAFGNRPQGVPDPEIIDWCAAQGATWLTTDISAKRTHEAALKARRISVVWCRQPKQGWSTKQQLEVIVKYLRPIEEQVNSPEVAYHFEVGVGRRSTLWLIWEGPRQPSQQLSLIP